jgi:hypothetical protein
MFNNHLFERRIKMEKAILTANENGIRIMCKSKDLKSVFMELYKMMLPTTKVGDIKNNLIKRL